MTYGWGYFGNLLFASAGSVVVICCCHYLSKVPWLSTFLSFCGRTSMLFLVWLTVVVYIIPFENKGALGEWLFKLVWLVGCMILSYRVGFFRRLFKL